MTFKVGDEVFVVKLDKDSSLYVTELVKFLNNGVKYKVHAVDKDGNVRLDTPSYRYYFKPEWLKLVSEVFTPEKSENTYLMAVGVQERKVTTYSYEGCSITFESRGKLLVHVFNQIISDFPTHSLGVTPENIDIHIAKMQQLKELCQNLK